MPHDVNTDCVYVYVTDCQMYEADKGWSNYLSEAHIPEAAWKTMETSLLPGDIQVKINKLLHTHPLFGVKVCMLLLMRNETLVHWSFCLSLPCSLLFKCDGKSLTSNSLPSLRL